MHTQGVPLVPQSVSLYCVILINIVIKTQISNLVRMTRFWYNLHQLKIVRLESQTILNFGNNKTKGLYKLYKV